MTKRSFTMLGITLIVQALLLSACNTTEGAGKDIKSAGKAIEDTAKDAK